MEKSQLAGWCSGYYFLLCIKKCFCRIWTSCLGVFFWVHVKPWCVFLCTGGWASGQYLWVVTVAEMTLVCGGGLYSPSETGWGAGRHWKQNHCSSALKGARWGGCGQEALGRLHSEVAGGGDQRGTRWGSTSLGWNCLRIRQESKMAALQTDLGLATGNGWRLGLWYETMLGFSFFYNSYRVRKALHSTP